MLKKSLYEMDQNIFSSLEDLWGLLTCGDKETGFNTMAVSWGGIGVLWGKKVAYVFVRKSRYTYEFIEKSNSVTLSFLSNKYKSEKAVFGSKSGRDIDKFKETGLHAVYEPDYNGYYVREADFVFKMKKLFSTDIDYTKLDKSIIDRYYKDGDMHVMYVCEISQFLVNEE